MIASASKLKIIYRRASDLKLYGANARTHSDRQIKQIADSIKAYGWTNPILVDKDLTVLAGHGRLAAAKTLGLEKVPTIQVSSLSEAERKAYIIADNKLAENAGWDKELLAQEFSVIAKLDADFDFDVTGFAAPAVDWLLSQGENDNGSGDDEDLGDLAAGPVVSRPGDLWKLGSHRLYCGDAADPGSYAELLEREEASLIFTDPPYNLPIDGFVSGHGRPKHDEFAMAAGELSEAGFIVFLETIMQNMSDVSADGSLHYICMDWRHAFEVMSAARKVYNEQKNLCVWNKANAGMGSFYRSKHELVFVFKNGKAGSINNIALGKAERYRTNIWDYPSASTFSKTRNDDLASHPTIKPIDMVADAILDASGRGDIVLDPFVGSGTTILAAERTGRHAAAMEINPAYVDLAIRRYEAATNKVAILTGMRKSFEEVAEERAPKAAQAAGGK
ncbi:site-specific DNA-methyltransferase [Hyphococcus sp.]|uniref:site-specific DNA-methyltransferase n=1 Tax=Hyphococcus sp. TaxID=2038636 RepID=UPI0035C743F5